MAAFSSNFELNTFLPLVAYNLFISIEILSKGVEIFIEKTLKGLKANEEICKRYAENSPALATPLSLKIGYDKTAELVKKANLEKKSILKIIKVKEIEEIFNLKKLAFPHQSIEK